MAEDKIKKIITLSACLLIMAISALVLLNQIRLNGAVKEIEDSFNKNREISWADGDNNVNDGESTNNYLVKMQENITDGGDKQQSTAQMAYSEVNSEPQNTDGGVLSGYVVNTNSRKIHSPDCASAAKMSDKNKKIISASEFDEYISNGYSVCSVCNAGN